MPDAPFSGRHPATLPSPVLVSPPRGAAAPSASISSYSVGSTISVSRVDVTMPPITTVASGRWTSAPAPCESAIGTKPSDGHERRHQHRPQPRRRRPRSDRLAQRPGARPRAARLMAAIITTPFSTATPKSAMKPTEADRLR